MDDRKFIFIVLYQFFNRDFQRYGIEYLVNCGYNVEIWRMINKDSVNVEILHNKYNGKNYYEYTFEEFKGKIKDNKDAIYMLQRTQDLYSLEIVKSGARYVISCAFGAIISVESFTKKRTFWDYAGKVVRNAFKTGIIKYSLKHAVAIYKNYQREKTKKEYINAIQSNPPLLVVASTKYATEIYNLKEELKGNVLYVHTWDYDRVIEAERKGQKKCTERFILFCDSGDMRPAYDYILAGKNFNEKNYYSVMFNQLYELFEKLERHYGIPVKVAGHPHSIYGENEFQGRKLIFNNTAELARDCDFFLVTTSTAQNYAAIYDKPILKLNCNFQKKLPACGTTRYEYIKYESEILGCGYLNMDDPSQMNTPWKYIKKMDPVKREQFIKDCIIDNDTKDRTIIEYTEEYLRKLI